MVDLFSTIPWIRCRAFIKTSLLTLNSIFSPFFASPLLILMFFKIFSVVVDRCLLKRGKARYPATCLAFFGEWETACDFLSLLAILAQGFFGGSAKREVMHSFPHYVNTFFLISSTVPRNSGSAPICFSIFLTEWIMVVWSLPPNSRRSRLARPW